MRTISAVLPQLPAPAALAPAATFDAHNGIENAYFLVSNAPFLLDAVAIKYPCWRHAQHSPDPYPHFRVVFVQRPSTTA